MMRVRFSVPFVVGKGRPRFGRGRAYTPKATADAEKQIAAAFLDAGGKCIPRGVGVNVCVVVSKGWTKGRPSWCGKEDWGEWRERGVVPDLSKPDVDNVAKLVLDALNGVAYEDDAQVVQLSCSRLPRVKGGETSTRVYVHTIPDDDFKQDTDEWGEDGQ